MIVTAMDRVLGECAECKGAAVIDWNDGGSEDACWECQGRGKRHWRLWKWGLSEEAWVPNVTVETVVLVANGLPYKAKCQFYGWLALEGGVWNIVAWFEMGPEKRLETVVGALAVAIEGDDL